MYSATPKGRIPCIRVYSTSPTRRSPCITVYRLCCINHVLCLCLGSSARKSLMCFNIGIFDLSPFPLPHQHQHLAHTFTLTARVFPCKALVKKGGWGGKCKLGVRGCEFCGSAKKEVKSNGIMILYQEQTLASRSYIWRIFCLKVVFVFDRK